MKSLMFPAFIVAMLTAGANVAVAQDASRKVPVMSESTYKVLSEAQLLVDPASAANAPANAQANPQANPQAAISMLYSLLGRPGINSYERAQTWNTLAYAYYLTGDLQQAIGAYESVLRETITEALEQSTLRALFQLYYSEENYPRSIEYIDRWQALAGKPNPDVTYIKATAYYSLGDFQSALREALLVERMAEREGNQVKEDWLYLQVATYNELGDLENSERVLTKLNTMYPKAQYQRLLASMQSGAGPAETVAPDAHPVFDLEGGTLRLKADNVEGFRSAGIVPGTQIVGIKFQKIATWADLAALELRPGAPITVEVQRGTGTTFLPVRLTAGDVTLITTPAVATIELEQAVDVAGDGIGVSDGEYLPIVKVAPVYPRRALSRGMEGWVIVEFTVARDGSVKNPVVVENCAWIEPAGSNSQCTDSPNGIFDAAALRAAEKFKYKPKVIDGEPTETHGMRNAISFDLYD